MNQNGFKVPDRHVINAAKLFHNISEGLEPVVSYGGNPGKSWYKSFIERFPIAAHNQSSDFHKIEFSPEKVMRVCNLLLVVPKRSTLCIKLRGH